MPVNETLHCCCLVRYGPALARRGVTFVQGRVAAIHVARQEVEVAGVGAARRLGYDTLIVALGGTTTVGALGAAEHAAGLDEPLTIGRAAVELCALAPTRGQALIVGGGLTAVEAAAELASAHCLQVRVSQGLSSGGGLQLGRAAQPAPADR